MNQSGGLYPVQGIMGSLGLSADGRFSYCLVSFSITQSTNLDIKSPRILVEVAKRWAAEATQTGPQAMALYDCDMNGNLGFCSAQPTQLYMEYFGNLQSE